MTIKKLYHINYIKAYHESNKKFPVIRIRNLNPFNCVVSFAVPDTVETASTEEKKVGEAATEAAASATAGSTEDERPGQANSLEASEAKSRRRRAPIGRTTPILPHSAILNLQYHCLYSGTPPKQKCKNLCNTSKLVTSKHIA